MLFYYIIAFLFIFKILCLNLKFLSSERLESDNEFYMPDSCFIVCKQFCNCSLFLTKFLLQMSQSSQGKLWERRKFLQRVDPSESGIARTRTSSNTYFFTEYTISNFCVVLISGEYAAWERTCQETFFCDAWNIQFQYSCAIQSQPNPISLCHFMTFTIIIINYTKQCHFWDSISLSACQYLPAFYGNRKFITVFKIHVNPVHNLTLYTNPF